jgi:uncharacterized membrane protein YdjX (TVP38/TMEM64 family)
MRIARRHVATGAAVGALVAVGLLFSPAAAIDRLRSVVLSPWFPVVLAGLYLVRPLLVWPITALSVLVGYRYGLVVGVPVALAGGVLTSLLPYAAARYFDTGAGLVARARSGSERFFGAAGDLRGVTAARLAPTPAEVVSVAAGMARVSLPAFVVGTVVGELPWTIAAVVAGQSMRELSLSGAETADPVLVGGGIVAALVLLAAPAYRLFGEWRARTGWLGTRE